VPKKRKPSSDKRATAPEAEAAPARVRIIGGHHRGRLLQYDGDLRTRPMKDRVREAVFNLVGPLVKGKHAIDLFAGTGALGLEALSRGAVRATFIERHFPTAAIIEQNIATLGLEAVSLVRAADTFIWARRELPTDATPWLVFCSPPYDLYESRHDDMLQLIERLLAAAPADSLLVVEADARFDFAKLPAAGAWDVRAYPPAIVALSSPLRRNSLEVAD
jgi:16S rRNA (guanine(966)-N(2))-methyltransferase RsmD